MLRVWDNGERNKKLNKAEFLDVVSISKDSAFNVAYWGLERALTVCFLQNIFCVENHICQWRQLHLSLFIFSIFVFSSPIALDKICSEMMNITWKSKHPCLMLDLNEKIFRLSSLTSRFFTCLFYQAEQVFFYFWLAENFYQNCPEFRQTFFVYIELMLQVFVKYFD